VPEILKLERHAACEEEAEWLMQFGDHLNESRNFVCAILRTEKVLICPFASSTIFTSLPHGNENVTETFVFSDISVNTDKCLSMFNFFHSIDARSIETMKLGTVSSH
jgi:hypothetical protein